MQLFFSVEFEYAFSRQPTSKMIRSVSDGPEKLPKSVWFLFSGVLVLGLQVMFEHADLVLERLDTIPVPFDNTRF